MRFLIVSCVFPPEPVVSGKTCAQLAEELVNRGHDVTVITSFPSRPAGRVYYGYKRRLINREKDKRGFELLRCFSFLSPQSSLGSRFLENISFGLIGGLAALTSPRSDVIYANTWPIFATGILFLVSKLRRVPMVITIQDVYPESLISQKRISACNPIAQLMRWLDGIIARRSRAVIVISKRFAAIYRNKRCVDQDRLYVIPNWVDKSSIKLDDKSNQFRKEKNIPQDAFVIAYGGNIGVAAGIQVVIEAFKFLNDVQNLYLLIAGEGSQLGACRELADEILRGRIIFHTPWPIEETSQVLRAANVLILPTRSSQSLSSVPSKLISYMLAGRPVIALALLDSDIASMVKRSMCGWIVDPDQPELVAAQIKKVIAMGTHELIRRGESGRAFILENLTREVCLPKVLQVLENAVQ